MAESAERRGRVTLRSAAILGLGAMCFAAMAFAPAATVRTRPRLVVLTDFFKDPDDKQSLIRLLTYANEFEIEGLVATSLAFGDGAVHPEWIQDVIGDYAKVLDSLRRHERTGFEYPSADRLRPMVKAGAPVIRQFGGRNRGFPVPYPPGARDSRTCDPPEKWIGPGKDTPGSRHIIATVDRDDPRPLWIAVWGGAMDLAQALWTVRHERTPEQARRFVSKLRVYQVSWQDTGAVWIWENFPDLFMILSYESHGGMYAEGSQSMRDVKWVDANVRRDHGPLGAGYPDANPPGIKEGDSPSFLHLLASGLSDPEHPEWGGWGGRFQLVDARKRFYVDAGDNHPESKEDRRMRQWTVGRWNEAASHDFAARMDWCVRGAKEANHAPLVVVSGDASASVLQREVRAGERVRLDASGTRDPDGDAIDYHWWPYVEAGSSAGPVAIENARSVRASFVAPDVKRRETIHVVVSATDRGAPPLTGYRRIVIAVIPGN